jgi:hypothetical protein
MKYFVTLAYRIIHLTFPSCYRKKYSRRRLLGSLWAMEKVIPITERSNYPNSLFQ